jgi:hypothetical protein
MNMRSRILVFAAALAAVLFSAGVPLSAQEKTETIERAITMAAERPAELLFKDVDGVLILRPSTHNVLSVKVRKEALTRDAKRADRLLRDTRVEIDRRDNEVSVRIRYPRLGGIFFWISEMRRIRVVSEISVPAGAIIRAGVVDGSISGDGLRADMTLEAVDGEIRIEDFAGRLSADSIDGRITVSGEIRGLRLETTDGEIRLEAAPGSALTDDWTLRTVDGDIDARFPPGFSADLSIRTGDGKLDTTIPVEPEKRRFGGKSYSARLGQGGRLVSIRTVDGDIRIR